MEFLHDTSWDILDPKYITLTWGIGKWNLEAWWSLMAAHEIMRSEIYNSQCCGLFVFGDDASWSSIIICSTRYTFEDTGTSLVSYSKPYAKEEWRYKTIKRQRKHKCLEGPCRNKTFKKDIVQFIIITDNQNALEGSGESISVSLRKDI